MIQIQIQIQVQIENEIGKVRKKSNHLEINPLDRMTEYQRVFNIRVQLKLRDSSLNRSKTDRKIDSCETKPCSECRKIERDGHVLVTVSLAKYN